MDKKDTTLSSAIEEMNTAFNEYESVYNTHVDQELDDILNVEDGLTIAVATSTTTEYACS